MHVIISLFFFCSFLGQICNGHCCDKLTEQQLIEKSTNNFEIIVKLHTKSHRSLWESTSNTFRGKYPYMQYTNTKCTHGGKNFFL